MIPLIFNIDTLELGINESNNDLAVLSSLKSLYTQSRNIPEHLLFQNNSNTCIQFEEAVNINSTFQESFLLNDEHLIKPNYPKKTIKVRISKVSKGYKPNIVL
ncbi:MAG: hypothetical protein KDB74_05475 [Flavobacteriales bacterium]|nr:hypothetical protein [Flavobacteriales bacterium]